MPRQPRRTKYIDQSVVAALRDIAVLDAALVALDFAVRIHSDHLPYYEQEGARADAKVLRLGLYRRKAGAQERALLFGSLSLNEELRRRALQEAAAFIARKDAEIMGYLQVNGLPPGQYFTDVHTDFRAEIDAAIAELVGTSAKRAEETTLEELHQLVAAVVGEHVQGEVAQALTEQLSEALARLW